VGRHAEIEGIQTDFERLLALGGWLLSNMVEYQELPFAEFVHFPVFR